MEQYPVPQFIEQEGRIAFFLSFSQFFYLAGGGLACFMLYYVLPFPLFLPLAAVIGIASVGVAFVKINGMPILDLVLNSLGFAVGGKNYVWRKQENPYPFKHIERPRIQKIDKGPVLQAQPSQLRKIKTTVEMKTK